MSYFYNKYKLIEYIKLIKILTLLNFYGLHMNYSNCINNKLTYASII